MHLQTLSKTLTHCQKFTANFKPHNMNITTLEGANNSGFKTKDGRELWTDEEKDKAVQEFKDYRILMMR